jgi:hypothetical protein
MLVWISITLRFKDTCLLIYCIKWIEYYNEDLYSVHILLITYTSNLTLINDK